MIKTFLRTGIERLPAPWPVRIQNAFRYLRYGQIRRRRIFERVILGELGTMSDKVGQGPFRGMSYITSAFCSEILPKIVGTYEKELNQAIEAICDAGCDRIIDIGAAEGYYAVGLALRNPQAQVIGFEMNASARYYLQQLAQLNEASTRIEIRGICDPDSLARAMEGAEKPAVICDCEGAEDLLLRPDRIEPLRRSYLLVETHDGLENDGVRLEGITDRLTERFEPTHEVRRIASTERTERDLPTGIHLTPELAAEAMNEGRPWAQWLFLSPRN